MSPWIFGPSAHLSQTFPASGKPKKPGYVLEAQPRATENPAVVAEALPLAKIIFCKPVMMIAIACDGGMVWWLLVGGIGTEKMGDPS